jgi:nucleotide-binding universal stress UspA family protein
VKALVFVFEQVKSKEMVKTTRLLLPFTHGMEMETLEAAVQLAASHHATLVPLSLISVPQARGKGARLEHIQQSKDFLEAAQQKALRHYVPLERFEAFTGDVVQSIALLVPRLACDGMILALRGRNGSLLRAQVIEQLMAIAPCSLYVIYLPSTEPSWVARLRGWFSNLWPGRRRQPHVEEPVVRPSPAQEVIPEMVLSMYVSSPETEQ